MPQQTHRRPADSGTGGRGLVEPTQWQSGQGGLALYNRCRSHIRDLYTGTAAIFRRLRLVRPGKLEAEEEEFIYDIEKLIGSDPTFEKGVAELKRMIKSNTLAFWLEGAPVMCSAAPFFRLG